MPPRKRLKFGHKSSSKQQDPALIQCCQDSHKSNSNLETKTDGYENFYLSLLPNEVLLYIYEFLSPLDLLSLTKLNNERLSELTYTVREANMSTCRQDNSLHLKEFFTKTRMQFIQKLNFNHFFRSKPGDLTHFICGCKNLVSLSVIECGLLYPHIQQILSKCEKLEQLAWNTDQVCQFPNACLCPNMKSVHLFSDGPNCINFASAHFPNVEDIWCNFAMNFMSASPVVGPWVFSHYVKDSELTKGFTFTITSLVSAYPTHILRLSQIIEGKLKYRMSGDYDVINEATLKRVYSNPPYMQTKSTNEDISLFSSSAPKVYSTVVLILTVQFLNVSDSFIKCIKEVAGTNLRQFSIQSCSELLVNEGHQTVEQKDICKEVNVLVCAALETMFLSSKYVTVLNLTLVHFAVGSPVQAITHLKFLKNLSIPTCAFDRSTDFQNSKLSSIVSSCPKVEEFSLNCCDSSSGKPSEDDIVCIKDWPLLKHLSIYCITYRTCYFLRKVADSCVQLQSLSLVAVAPRKTCLYTTDVIYLLKKAKNLRFLRINDARFNPMFERFWASIGEAVNLEGICIHTYLEKHIDKQTVLSGIKNLKYLHLFHFYAPRLSDRLNSDVRKSMREHGIINTRIELGIGMRYPKEKHHHRLPHISCSRSHLNEFDLF